MQVTVDDGGEILAPVLSAPDQCHGVLSQLIAGGDVERLALRLSMWLLPGSQESPGLEHSGGLLSVEHIACPPCPGGDIEIPRRLMPQRQDVDRGLHITLRRPQFNRLPVGRQDRWHQLQIG